jgi:hypothetical protein
MKRGNHYTHRHKKKIFIAIVKFCSCPLKKKYDALVLRIIWYFLVAHWPPKSYQRIYVFFTFKNIKWLIYSPNKENYNYWPTIFMSFYFLYYNKKKHFCHWNKKIRHTFKGIFVILHRLICLFYIHEEHFDLFTLNN